MFSHARPLIIFYWQGPGYYAPVARRPDDCNVVEYYCLEVGKAWYNDADKEARSRNLGTPTWYETMPSDAIVGE